MQQSPSDRDRDLAATCQRSTFPPRLCKLIVTRDKRGDRQMRADIGQESHIKVYFSIFYILPKKKMKE